MSTMVLNVPELVFWTNFHLQKIYRKHYYLCINVFCRCLRGWHGGLLSVKDEILEVNVEKVACLSLDQVTHLFTMNLSATVRVLQHMRTIWRRWQRHLHYYNWTTAPELSFFTKAHRGPWSNQNTEPYDAVHSLFWLRFSEQKIWTKNITKFKEKK